MSSDLVYVVQGNEHYDWEVFGVFSTTEHAQTFLDEQFGGEGWVDEHLIDYRATA